MMMAMLIIERQKVYYKSQPTVERSDTIISKA